LLVTNGQSSDAKKIGYASKVIETRLDFKNRDWPTFETMLVYRWISGYGYYPYRAILWLIFYCALGAFVFSRTNPDEIRVSEGVINCVARSGWRKYVLGPFCFRVIKYTKGQLDTNERSQDSGVINPFAYSFDALLPVIKLREVHNQIEFDGWRHYYFYLQKTTAWIIGTLIVALGSGLTK
jgi:hypothetical protein